MTDGLLEIAAVTLTLDGKGKLHCDQTFAYQVEPFVGARIDPEALSINGMIQLIITFCHPRTASIAYYFFENKKIINRVGLSTRCIGRA